MRSVLLALLALLAVPAAAAAVETEGRGQDVRHVQNIPYPNVHAPDETNAGTDLEFATITVSPPEAPAAAAPVQPTAKAPARKQRSTKRSTKRRAATRRCRTVTRKRRGRTVRTRVCSKAKARRKPSAKRRATRRDAQPSVPGVQRTFAFAGSYGDGLHVIDVTDPAASRRVATWDCGISQGDVQVFRRDDLGGRWFLTFTHDDGYDFHQESQCAKDLAALGFAPGDLDGAGTFIAEVTDPYAPRTVSYVGFEQGSHNMTVHPSGRYLYNSNSDLITSLLPAVEIADITDLSAPRVVGEIDLLTFPGLGTESHDISFSADGSRAYVAALSHGEILDTTDPVNPRRVGVIIDPLINVWHQTEAITIDDPIFGEREFLIAEDEVAGALGTGQCPNGGVHVFDITGDLERTPVPVGYWNIDDVGLTEDGLGTCTAHVFQLHREEQLMTIAYYNGGVRVVDLKGLVGVALGRSGVGMKQLGFFRFPDSDTWAVKAPRASRSGFHLFGNDHRRGFDVYEYRPSMEGRSSAGRWLSREQALARVRRAAGSATLKVAALCLLDVQRRT